MSTFNKTKLLNATVQQIPMLANAIMEDFTKDGHEVDIQEIADGGCDISIAKGGVFKSVLGMKTALKVELKPTANGVLFDAHVGIFKQHIIPTLGMYFVTFWPLLVTQIWGLVKQAKLDDRALAVVEKTLMYAPKTSTASGIEPSRFFDGGEKPQPSIEITMYCGECGKPLPADSKFCTHCGKPTGR